MLVVSHNRHFLDSVCNVIYYLDEDGLKKFKGNYEEYKLSLKNSNNDEQIDEKEEKKVNYQEQKEMNRRVSKLKRGIDRLEQELDKLNKEKEELEKKYYEAGKSNNIEIILEIQEKISVIGDLEIKKLEEWENKSKELEEY